MDLPNIWEVFFVSYANQACPASRWIISRSNTRKAPVIMPRTSPSESLSSAEAYGSAITEVWSIFVRAAHQPVSSPPVHPPLEPSMSRVRVGCFTISLDGYGAGPWQDLDNPLGIGGMDLHQWMFPTRTLQRALFGKEGGTTGVDMRALGYKYVEFVASEKATHVVLER